MRVKAVLKDRLQDIAHESWVDAGRRPFIEGETAWVPVKDGGMFDRDIPERNAYQGRGFFMIGNVAVIHGKKPSRSQVDEIVSFRHPEGVLWIESLRDVTRTPVTEVLWGDVGEQVHHESGFTYILDPRKVMFAQGNRDEKMRLARLVHNDGVPVRVADMFAGIGYFTIPLAGSGAMVHAMEINPVAFEYLNRNVVANGLSDRVTTSLGDCRNLLTGIYDRIVMGHFDALGMLPAALRHVQPGSTIYLHGIGTETDQVRTIVEGAGFSATIDVHKVKKYRPHALHVVLDVIIS